MTISRASLLFAIVAVTTTPFAQAQETPRGQRPNILILIADDLGWNDVGYHGSEIKTPNLDRLATESVELDQHYVQPVCTPTRVALFTGRYPSRFGLHATSPSNDHCFPHETPTLATLLKGAGYETGLIGKWHMGSKPEWGPNTHGFDYSYGSLAGAVGMYDHRYRLGSPFEQTWHRNGEFLPPDEPGHATDLVTGEAVKFIEKDRKSPFFLWVAFQSVHTPLVEETMWLQKNEHINSTDRRLYAGAVTHLDDCIGQIIKSLERTGQRENTLVLFTSDNGAQVNHAGNAYPPPDSKLTNHSSNEPLRGKKAETFEGGMRVPAFVSWPGQLRQRKVTAPIHLVDWLPTLTRLAGAEAPADWTGDGQDIWPQIADGEPYSSPRTFYWIVRRNWSALRQGDWKIVRKKNEPWMLFNLADDPLEQRDLAKDNPDQLDVLVQAFKAEQAKDAE